MGQDNVSLLLSVWAEQSVHSFHLDIVQLLASLLDLGLVGTSIHDENESVIVFNGFDGALGAKRVLDNGIFVPRVLFRNTLFIVLWFATQLESCRSTEGDFVPHLMLLLLVTSLLQRGCGLLCLQDSLEL